MRVRWTPRARDHFRHDTRFIALDSPTAAREVAARVRKAANSLADHPLMGREGRVIDTRELLVSRTPYTIAYRVRGQVVEIVGVIHQARQWPETFEEAAQ
ncbi:MAG TPA: type II toxin-antitoxin system RelE/ParE family toxin [Chloroflexota bacterium]|nr:type II toxin-antitoxin system RelE/ParE family toxin [Chloroflexota bacterium]